MKSGVSPLFQSFIYDFKQDGGAVGSINTGIQLPNLASVFVIGCTINESLTGGEDVNFSLGTSASPSLFGIITSIFLQPAPNIYTGWWGLPASSQSNPGIMDNTLNVIFTIGNQPMTGGRFSCFMQYFLFQ